MIRPAKHHDADAVFSLELLEDLAALRAEDTVHELVLGFEARLDGAYVLLPRESQDVLELIEELFGQQGRIAGIHEGIQKKDIILTEDIAFLGEGRLDGFRRRRYGGAGAMRLRVRQVARQIVNHGAEDDVERLLLVMDVKQVVHVWDTHFGREAGIDGAALGAFLVKSSLV